MANELCAFADTGLTVYAVLLSSTGTIWNGSAFVTIAAGSWTSYDVAMTEAAAGIYLATMPTSTAGAYSYVAYKQAGAAPAITDKQLGDGFIQWDGTAEIYDADIYTAKVWLYDDDANSYDRYNVVWYKNGVPVTSGITTPLIQVIKSSDGADLVASVAMTQSASTGLYYYNEATNRITSGAAYVIKVTATIGGAARTHYQPTGRDSQT